MIRTSLWFLLFATSTIDSIFRISISVSMTLDAKIYLINMDLAYLFKNVVLLFKSHHTYR